MNTPDSNATTSWAFGLVACLTVAVAAFSLTSLILGWLS